MNHELYRNISGAALRRRNALLSAAGLHTDEKTDVSVLVYDGERAIATGSRSGAVLKLFATDDGYRGEDLTSTVVTALVNDARENGYGHLFLYTKPEYENIFSGLFFYPVARSRDVLLMENRPGGISSFLSSLPKPESDGINGALVMNANPFTLGHLHLAERAASECDRVYLFVLSEDKSEFSTADRVKMVTLGVSHLKNVTVLETGPYMVSSATFPTYFLKNRESAEEVHCGLDIEIFAGLVAKRLSVTRRYVGTEPLSPTTNKYNEAMARLLPKRDIQLIEVPRAENSDGPISAGRYRALIKEGKREAAFSLLPKTSRDYILENKLI